MDSSKPIDAKEAEKVERPLDPFAVDFFGEKKSVAAEKNKPATPDSKPSNGGRKKILKSAEWFKTIPHLTRAEAAFSERIEKLPDNLTKAAAHKISEIITRYTFQAPKNVRCQMISITEVDLGETLAQLEKSPQTFLALGCRPDHSTALIAFDTGFASSVIDLILSGKSEPVAFPRRLSPIENTIVEFLAGNVLAGINDWVGQNLFCLLSADNMVDKMFEKNQRGAEAVFRLDFADFSGIITLLASKDFLVSADRTQNPLLVEKNAREKFASLEKIAPLLNTRVRIGETALEAASLAYLEPDDIVLIERPLVEVRDSTFSGAGRIFLGSGDNFYISGRFLEAGEAPDPAGVNFRPDEIRSFTVRRKINFERPGMERMNNENAETSDRGQTDDENLETIDASGDAEEGAGAALENVLVNLRVEIAGDKISLREIQNLRAGQIIDLGCRPTDPVRLVTDTSDQPVAVGELVDIEGRLGVRLTRIFI